MILVSFQDLEIVKDNFFYGSKGDKGNTGAAGPQGEKGDKGDTRQGIKFGHLTVIKHIINLNKGTAKASCYTFHVDENNQSPDTIPGSEDGTEVTLGFESYSVSETQSKCFSSQCWSTI